VIFTSNNGFMEGQHRIKSGKLVAYEASTALPLLMRGPGSRRARLARAGGRHRPGADDPRHGERAPRRLDDRRPLDAAVRPGSRPPAHDAPAAAGDRPAGQHARDLDQEGRLGRGEVLRVPRYGGVSTARYRYLRYRNGEAELYNLRRDPEELVNLIHDPRYRAARRVLRRQLRRLSSCAGAECRKRIGAVPGPAG
jgi:N-acetylglucosamine-6-sulfatase